MTISEDRGWLRSLQLMNDWKITNSVRYVLQGSETVINVLPLSCTLARKKTSTPVISPKLYILILLLVSYIHFDARWNWLILRTVFHKTTRFPHAWPEASSSLQSERYSKDLINLDSSVRTVRYGSTLFLWIYDPRPSRLGHKWEGKNWSSLFWCSRIILSYLHGFILVHFAKVGHDTY